MEELEQKITASSTDNLPMIGDISTFDPIDLSVEDEEEKDSTNFSSTAMEEGSISVSPVPDYDPENFTTPVTMTEVSEGRNRPTTARYIK